MTTYHNRQNSAVSYGFNVKYIAAYPLLLSHAVSVKKTSLKSISDSSEICKQSSVKCHQHFIFINNLLPIVLSRKIFFYTDLYRFTNHNTCYLKSPSYTLLSDYGPCIYSRVNTSITNLYFKQK